MPTRTAAPYQEADEILAILSSAALEIGAKLDAVFDAHPSFDQWVEDNLPIKARTAERLRAMWLVHAQCAGNTNLPEPWKTWWDLG